MTKFTGNCLCGDVSFAADGEIAMMGNCHCKDCQQVTGAAYATMVFLKDDEIKVTGETKRFEHPADSGNVLTKDFCPNCGSQMFGSNLSRPGMTLIRAGVINEQEYIKPQFNVYASGKMDCIALDPDIPAFDKMPG